MFGAVISGPFDTSQADLFFYRVNGLPRNHKGSKITFVNDMKKTIQREGWFIAQ